MRRPLPQAPAMQRAAVSLSLLLLATLPLAGCGWLADLLEEEPAPAAPAEASPWQDFDIGDLSTPPVIVLSLSHDRPEGMLGGETVTFTAHLGELNPAEFVFAWDFGDSSTLETSAQPDEDGLKLLTTGHIYSYPGTYDTRLKLCWRKNVKVCAEALTSVVVRLQPELVLSTVKLLGDEPVAVGDSVNLALSIGNDGGAFETAFETAIFLSTTGKLDASSQQVHTAKHQGMGGVDRGQALLNWSKNKPLSFKLPDQVPAGQVWVFVHVDWLDQVGELNELDNIAFATSLLENVPGTSAAPDLTITAPKLLSAEVEVAQGDLVSYGLTLSNIGVAEAKNFKFTVYLSADDKLDVPPAGGATFDPLVFDTPVNDPSTSVIPLLPAGASLPITYNLAVPDVPAGKYRLIAFMDSEEVVLESSESNNVAVGGEQLLVVAKVVQGFDLAVQSMTVLPPSMHIGGAVAIKYTVASLGTTPTPPFPARIWFCPGTLIPMFCLLNQTSFTIPALAPGLTYDGTQVVMIAPMTPLQKWNVYLQLDPDNQLAELNEGNNLGWYKGLDITGQVALDLVPKDVAFHPPQVKAGEFIKVSYKATNKGPGPAVPTTTAIVLSPKPVFSLDALAKGDGVVLAWQPEDPIAAGDHNAQVAKVLVPAALDQNVNQWHVGVILDAKGVEFAEPPSAKFNNGLGAATKLQVKGALGGCLEDVHDEGGKNNDSAGQATTLGPGVYDKLALCQGEDWYGIVVAKGHSLQAKLLTTDLKAIKPVPGALALEIRAPDGGLLDAATGLAKVKTAAGLTVAKGGLYMVRVLAQVPGAKAHYSLTLAVSGPPPGTDLYAKQLLAWPNATFSGGLVKTKLKLGNLGQQAAKTFHVRYLLSKDAKADAADLVLLTAPVTGGLGAASTLTLQRDLTVPKVAGGAWHVLALLDPLQAIAEADEGNNAATSNAIHVDGTATCKADAMAGNHTVDSAAKLGAASKTWANLNVCPGLEDWFALDLKAGQALTAQLNWKPVAGKGSLRLQIVDPSKGAVMAGSANAAATVARLPFVQVSGTYFVHVFVVPDQGQKAWPVDYALDIKIGAAAAADVCKVDPYEGNESPLSAKLLGCGMASLSLCLADQDWFTIQLTKGETLKLELTHPDNALRMALMSQPAKTLAGNGQLTFVAPASGNLLLRVWHMGDAKPAQGFAYTLEVDGGSGVDLVPVILGLHPANATQNGNVFLAAGLSNTCKTAAGPFHYGWYLSKDNKLDAGDALLADKNVPGGLAGKTDLKLSDVVVVPKQATPGPSWLILQADSKGQVAEGQELNNVDQAPLMVNKVCLPDVFDSQKPNQTAGQPTTLPAGKTAGLSICPADVDWYVFQAGKGQLFSLSALFEHKLGDLDLRLYDGFGLAMNKPLATSATAKAPEKITWKAQNQGLYYLKVEGAKLATTNVYDLVLCLGLGC